MKKNQRLSGIHVFCSDTRVVHTYSETTAASVNALCVFPPIEAGTALSCCNFTRPTCFTLLRRASGPSHAPTRHPLLPSQKRGVA
jgi:hypothetical protein